MNVKGMDRMKYSIKITIITAPFLQRQKGFIKIGPLLPKPELAGREGSQAGLDHLQQSFGMHHNNVNYHTYMYK